MVLATCAFAQEVDCVTGATRVKNDTTQVNKLVKAISRFHIGAYTEAVMTRNFYSQSFNLSTMQWIILSSPSWWMM